jgi:hypothetical protein
LPFGISNGDVHPGHATREQRDSIDLVEIDRTVQDRGQRAVQRAAHEPARSRVIEMQRETSRRRDHEDQHGPEHA